MPLGVVVGVEVGVVEGSCEVVSCSMAWVSPVRKAVSYTAED